MEEKMLVGSQVMEVAKKQQKELMKTKKRVGERTSAIT